MKQFISFFYFHLFHNHLPSPLSLMDRFVGRASLRNFLDNRKPNAQLRAAEIGVYYGQNAEVMLRLLNPAVMFAVDPYLAYSELDDIQRAKQHAHNILDGKVKWVESSNRTEIAREIGRLDYVYIDGAHDYENISADIIAYWPCVKSGGMLAGHDINHPPVFKAVAEFAVAKNLSTGVYENDWWYWKD